MEYMKRIEMELIIAWRSLQLEKNMPAKEAALKAYYAKFRAYQQQRVRNLQLFAV